MKLETLEDYDYEIKELESKIEEIEKYGEEYPEKQGVKGNLETLYHVHEKLIERRKFFLKKVEERNLLEKIRHEITINVGVWCTDNEKILKKMNSKCIWYNKENTDLLNELNKKIKELS